MPLAAWPPKDRDAWNKACQPGQRLRRGGAASHLREVTREDLVRHYGAFLGFLKRRGLLQRNGAPAANVTIGNVTSYVSDLKGRVGSVTVHGAVCRLRRAARYIAPRLDLVWLSELEKDLALLVQPRSKFGRVVMSDRLLQAGLALMQEADSSATMSRIGRATQFRNGLMVALLTLCPIRRKNYTALEIGRSFRQIRGKWWIVLTAAQTKEKRPDERPVDDLLAPFVARYLDEFRVELRGSAKAVAALWLSASTGAPMTAQQVANAVKRATQSTIGLAISPHLFRTAGASTVATYAGSNPHFGSALLAHHNPVVTQVNYNRATCLDAAEKLRKVLRRSRRRPDSKRS